MYLWTSISYIHVILKVVYSGTVFCYSCLSFFHILRDPFTFYQIPGIVEKHVWFVIITTHSACLRAIRRDIWIISTVFYATNFFESYPRARPSKLIWEWKTFRWTYKRNCRIFYCTFLTSPTQFHLLYLSLFGKICRSNTFLHKMQIELTKLSTLIVSSYSSFTGFLFYRPRFCNWVSDTVWILLYICLSNCCGIVSALQLSSPENMYLYVILYCRWYNTRYCTTTKKTKMRNDESMLRCSHDVFHVR